MKYTLQKGNFDIENEELIIQNIEKFALELKNERWKNYKETSNIIGHGNQAFIVEVKHKETKEKYAFKKIKLTTLNKSDRDQFIREAYNCSKILSD